MAISSGKLIPPCQSACPVGTRARDYVRVIAMDRLEEAYKIITENNPFPSVCGRVCMHPCEEACRRNEVDEPVSIAALKRYASDYVNENGLFFGASPLAKSGKKVAIVGAGPSGLAASVKLAEAGHLVKVFEKNNKAGGMLRYGIPRYRLSDAALDEDIKRIEAKGVKIETGKAIGKNISLDSLTEDYDAVLVSTGLSESRSLPIEGIDAGGVLLAIPFLNECNSGVKVEIGKKVLVIGGGNVAVDVARTARRLNPKAQITLACLESEDEMPASDWEMEEAREEKIAVKNCMGPKKVEVKGGKVKGMHFITCASVFDGEGRFNPRFKEKEKHYLDADTVIIAIGQQSDLTFMPAEQVNRGRLVFDNDTLAVTDDGVFTCGEVAKGPGAAISAIASGNEAARVINRYLANEPISLEEESVEVIGGLGKTAELVVSKKRQKTGRIEPKIRINNFEEFDKGFDRRAAVKEALRCMDCGSGALVDADKCITCLTCVRVCPFEVAEIDKETNIAAMPVEGCQACGACAADCPANAIDLIGYPLEEMQTGLEAVFTENKPEALGFLCQTGKDVVFGHSRLVRVKCPLRIPDYLFLKAFELGAKKVFAVCHNPDGCRYIAGPDYTERRVGYVKKILDNVGIGADKIEVFRKNQKEEITAFLAEKLSR